MAAKIYALGYTGRKPEEIKALVESLDATLFDIRLSPRSRVPHWNKGPLQKLLGDRYKHVKAFGNLGYKSGYIEIADMEEGVRILEESKGTILLMCACRDFEACHRTTVSEHLRGRGLQVTELSEEIKSRVTAAGSGLQLALQMD